MPNTWERIKYVQDVPDRINQLTALIDYTTDLSCMGGPTQSKEYIISEHGLFGMYLLNQFIVDEMERISAVVGENSNRFAG